MTFQLTLTTSTLLDWHQRLQRDPSARIQWPLGLSLQTDRTTWLVPPDDRLPEESETGPRLRVTACRSAGELARLADSARVPTADSEVLLGIGMGTVAGHLAASFRRADQVVAVDEIRLVGCEVEDVGTDRQGLPRIARHNAVRAKQETRFETWAPTREALGEETWQRFRSQQFGVMGLGRTGSTVAEQLHRNGARITAIDHDHFEPHNLGESALAGRMDVSRSKALVIAQRLEASSPNATPVVPVLHSVLSLAALPAIKDCTILISAVDNPTARLIIAFLSTIYMLPVLDLGTGIFHRQPDQSREQSARASRRSDRDMGADIRLCLPGRCLVCTGGVQNLSDAIQELKALLDGQTTKRPANPAWFEQRSGSLRSLNSCAVGLGLRLIEDWLAHRLSSDQNHWLHLEFNETGIPALETRQFPHNRNNNCPLCRLTGFGDAGLRRLPRVLHELLQSAEAL